MRLPVASGLAIALPSILALALLGAALAAFLFADRSNRWLWVVLFTAMALPFARIGLHGLAKRLRHGDAALVLEGKATPGGRFAALLTVPRGLQAAQTVSAELACHQNVLHHKGGGAMGLEPRTAWRAAGVFPISVRANGAADARITFALPPDATPTTPYASEESAGCRWVLEVALDGDALRQQFPVWVEPMPGSAAPPAVTPEDAAAMASQEKAVQSIGRVIMIAAGAAFLAGCAWLLYGMIRIAFG